MTRKERAIGGVRGAVALGLAWCAASALGVDEIFGIRGLDAIWAPTLTGVGLGALGLRRPIEWAAGLVYAALLLVATVPVFGRSVAGLTRRDSLPAEPADAVVVLSASVSADGDLNPTAVDRLLEGLNLVRTGAAPRLVLSRVRTTIHGDTVTSDADQRFLISLSGLDPEVTIVDHVGSTRLEAVRTAELGRGRGWHRLVVVTSPSHSRRACGAFEAVGFDVVCRPSADRVAALASQPRATDRLRGFSRWLYETLALAKYRARDWIP